MTVPFAMVRLKSFLFVLFAANAMAACTGGTIGGFDYAPEYDFSEFFAVSDGRPFRVVVAGNPFPRITDEEEKRALLPVMQANRPRPRLTFTYEVPAEEPHSDYRVVIVFNAANDLTAARVCAGQIRLKAAPPGRFDVFGIYCRNDMALTQAVTSIGALRPDDPRVGALFRQLFLVLFPEYPIWRPHVPFLLH